jgi:hypothetical protein
VGIRYAGHTTPSIRKKLALTSPTSGGHSVSIVRSQTKPPSLVACCQYLGCVAENGGMTNGRIVKDLEVNSHAIIEVLFWHLLVEIKEFVRKNKASVIKHLLNMNREHYSYSTLLSPTVP